MASVPGVTPEDMAVLERYGFKRETAYMEVPRCDWCKWWKRSFWGGEGGVGRCGLAGQVGKRKFSTNGEELLTAPDFGCVQWEGK